MKFLKDLVAAAVLAAALTGCASPKSGTGAQESWYNFLWHKVYYPNRNFKGSPQRVLDRAH